MDTRRRGYRRIYRLGEEALGGQVGLQAYARL